MCIRDRRGTVEPIVLLSNDVVDGLTRWQTVFQTVVGMVHEAELRRGLDRLKLELGQQSDFKT